MLWTAWHTPAPQLQVFPVEFCLQSSTVIQVSGVRYSNDGEADYVEVKFDDERIGTFESHDMASSGDNWNRFENSGPIGHPMEVLPGKHRLELIFVSTDRHGIEIDYVALDVADELQDERMLQCRAYCDSSINYKPSLVFDTLPSGWLEQRSRHTECAEELNVKLELYHPALASYQITARPPSYRTLLNNQEQDFHNCGGSEKDEAVWFFNDFDVLTAGDELRAGSGATLNFSGDDAASNTKLFVTFDTSSVSGQGPGAVLRLKFLRRAAEAGVVHVRLQANMTGRLLSEDRTVNPADSNREARWTLEASLLTEQPQAELVLTLVHNPSFPLRADYLRLVLQPQAEVVATVFKDRSTWVQTVANPRVACWCTGQTAWPPGTTWEQCEC
ncbi:uncharacterized protein LOC112557865 isoform X2 [Pomacea canaliculata]|uniref:uncharacterized protein LOC112557865 isoform X2 n=1 Tax=Pomacea canaliculata TaxID=400727 RepID=UPI000D731F26|nr:uncharacterized protein LOC112557865 isoform X2 [Pomacea canaliculata]